MMLLSLCITEHAFARPRTNSSQAFQTGEKLRGRVDFWKKIFARYGQHEVVIHHRRYPQASFKVLDFRDAAREYEPVALERFKKKVTDDRVAQIHEILRKCQSGGRPSNDFEASVFDAMKLVRSARSNSLAGKCEEALDEDLIRTQTGIKERYREALIRSGRYLQHMEDIFVNEFDLPLEVTRMPFIESSFDYKANSSVGASGIWQFMPRTARAYMMVNKAVDERRDPIVSSRGAARYLKQAYGSLGTWPLAVTSYNHGVAGVASKVRKAGTNNMEDLLEDPDLQPFGFASGNFFPELLAAIEVFDERSTYFPGIELESPLSFRLLKLNAPSSASSVSAKTGISSDILRQYNYALTESVWKGKLSIPKGYSVKIPAARSGTKAVQAKTEPQLDDTTATVSLPEVPPSRNNERGTFEYKVKKGDSLVKIGVRFGVSPSAIREANEMGPTSSILVGQLLLIPKQQRASEVSVETRVHKVRPGDSLWSISKTYHVTIDALKTANREKIGKGLKVGQMLTIPR